mgnify:FL=1
MLEHNKGHKQACSKIEELLRWTIAVEGSVCIHFITVVKSMLRFMLYVQVLIISVFVDLELSLGIDGVIKNIDQTGVKI